MGFFLNSSDINQTFIMLPSTGYESGNTVNINGDVREVQSNAEWRVAQADTGVLTFGNGLTYNSTTTINIDLITGYIIDNSTNPAIPTYQYINYSGETNKTVNTLGTGQSTYVMLDNNGISFQNTFPTSVERKLKIWLGKIGHPNGLITVVANEPDFITSPLSQHRDFFQAFNYINDGVYAYPNGSNLSVNIGGGTIIGNGINLNNSINNPNNLFITPQQPVNFLYRTKIGNGGGLVTNIDPNSIDVNGVITPFLSGASIQYVFIVPNGGYIIQYGQNIYSTLLEAVEYVGKEDFTIYPNLDKNSLLLGVIVVGVGATNLSNINEAHFFKADKIGQIIGSAGGVSTTTLQGAYNNSVSPQIVTNNVLGALTIKDGAGGTANTFSIISTGNTSLFNVKENGNVSIGTVINKTTPILTFINSAGTIINEFRSDVNANLAVGKNALTGMSSFQNTAIGEDALRSNTASTNTAIGFRALFNNVSGPSNCGIGYATLLSSLSGTGGTAVGYRTLQNIVTGSFNTGIGHIAGRYIADGSTSLTALTNSVLIGASSRPLANDETNTIVIGYNAIGIGSNSVVLGDDSVTKTALKGNVLIGTTADNGTHKLQVSGTTKITGDANINGLTVGRGGNNDITNTAIGVSALTSSNISSIDNVALGYQAGALNGGGRWNVFIGSGSGIKSTGAQNTFIGFNAGYESTSGIRTVNIGYQAGYSYTGSNVVNIGYRAGYAGGGGVAIGYEAGFSTSSANNSFVGYQSGNANTTGSSQTYIGNQAGYYNNIGSGNTFLGSEAGKYITNGSTTLTIVDTSVFLGAFTKASGRSQTNQIVIGYNAIGAGSNSVVLGNTGITKTLLRGNVLIGTTADTGTHKLQVSGTTLIIGSLTATTFVKSGGTSSQYLMADGSTSLLINNISGTGTTNTLPKFSSASTLTNSNISDNGSLVTITTDSLINGLTVGKGPGNMSQNTVFGDRALSANTTGNGNTAIGFTALKTSITAGANTAVGQGALEFTTASNNTAVGYAALGQDTTGAQNSAFGRLALTSLQTGTDNIGIGSNSGSFLLNGTTAYTASTQNILIGSNVKSFAQNQTNQIVIGYSANGLGSNSVVLGNDSIIKTALKGNVLVGTTGDTGHNLQVSGTSNFTSDAVINGLTVGKGGGNVNSNTVLGMNALITNSVGSGIVAIGNNALRFGTGSACVAIGSNAMSGSSTSVSNVGVGANALMSNTNGNNNVAIGADAGRFIADAVTPLTFPRLSIYIGDTARSLAASPINEIVIGQNAIGLHSNSVVLGNDLILKTALKGNILIGTTTDNITDKLQVTGSANISSDSKINGLTVGKGGGNGLVNTALGVNALLNNTGGTQSNTGVGHSALLANTAGSFHSAFGHLSLTSFIGTGDQNTAIGYATLRFLTGGSNNTVIGSQAGNLLADKTTNNTHSTNSVFLGFRTSPVSLGQTNQIVIGYDANGIGSNSAVLGNDLITRTVLKGSIIIGQTGAITDTGHNLQVSGTSNFTSDAVINGLTVGKGGGNQLNNTAFGVSALNVNTSGDGNTHIGYQSGLSNTTGNQNTSVGEGSLRANVTTTSNVSIGYNSLRNLTIGGGVTSIGHNSGRILTDGTTPLSSATNSIFIGASTRPFANGQTNEIVIGQNAIGIGSNSVVLGNDSIIKTVLRGNILIGTTGDTGQKLQVSGTAKVNQIDLLDSVTTDYKHVTFNSNNLRIVNDNLGVTTNITLPSSSTTVSLPASSGTLALTSQVLNNLTDITITGTTFTIDTNNTRYICTSSASTVGTVASGITGNIEVLRYGTGTVAFSAGTGTTLRYASFASPSISEQYASAALQKLVSAGEIRVFGELSSI